MSDLLVIADTHINPDNMAESIELWYRLGRYCTKVKPKTIVHLGDVADLSSQAWRVAARGKYSLEEECKTVSIVLAAFEKAIEDYNICQRRKKKKQYHPSKFLTLGNHDIRNGVTNIEDIFTDAGWVVVDYLHPLKLYNITLCHSMAKGLSDQMCTTAQELIENWGSDIVVGHGHHKDFYESYSMAVNRKITALKCPCFTVSDYDWAAQTQYKWSRGFTEIKYKPYDTFSFVWRDLSCLYKNL